jgi:hypothetical protein
MTQDPDSDPKLSEKSDPDTDPKKIIPDPQHCQYQPTHTTGRLRGTHWEWDLSYNSLYEHGKMRRHPKLKAIVIYIF